MSVNCKTIADSILNLIDTIIKLSTALLVVPIVFLKFISEVGAQVHPDALQGVYLVSNWLKIGLFGSFGLSIFSGLVAKYVVVHMLSTENIVSEKNWIPGLLD